ncbi:hypothetical protein TrRE_jg5765, partial [Triparma retinervis]
MERNKLYTRATVTVGGKEEGGGGGGATICTAQVQPTIVRVNEREPDCGSWCFQLNITVTSSHDNGCLSSAACNALVAALEGTRLPRLDLDGGEGGGGGGGGG